MREGPPTRSASGPWWGLADLLPVGIGLWFAWAVLATMRARLDYPFDLEWMEGGMLGHAWQILHDRPMYPVPGPDHISFVYPPGYTAWMALLSGGDLDYRLGRLLSLTSTLVAASAVAVGARRQGGHWGPGLAGALLYLTLYNASGAFYDLVRPDAMAVALFAWAVVVGLERNRMAPVASGLLLAAAYACKHNLAIFGIPLLAHYWLRVSPAHARRFALASIGSALAFTVYMHVVTGGTFLVYLVALPNTHGMNAYRAFPGTQLELVRFLFPGLFGAALYLGLRAYRRVGAAALALPGMLALVLGALGPGAGSGGGALVPRDMWVQHVGMAVIGFLAGVLTVVPLDTGLRRQLDRRWTVGALLAGVALGIGILMRSHLGGFLNVLMPVHWMICFGLAVLAGRARNLWPVSGTLVSAGFAAASLAWTGLGLELERLVPTDEDRVAGEQVVARLARECPEGPILSPYAAWLPVQAGDHPPSVHLIAIWDIDHTYGPYLDRMPVLEQAAADQYWTCVVDGGGKPLQYGIPDAYRTIARLPVHPGVWVARTGWKGRPTHILGRRQRSTTQ